MRYFFLLLLILFGKFGNSQVLECDRYTIFDLQDTVDGFGPGVYFKMTTDTNTYNTGYTDLYFVDQLSDTLNVYNWWSSWLPSTTNIPNDTIEYVLNYKTGISIFPTNFNGYLVSKNPDCNIPFNYTTMTVDQLSYDNEAYVIYPNPVQTGILIAKNSSDKHLTHVELYNVMGQLILTQRVNLQKIDLTRFEGGTYLLKLYSSDRQVLIKKIIKN
ncbi:MAG: T9SS type A sorting domain-containing protein [Bacteroidota bacterium]|nr:T9SS type A sorting domain-containing protein [Bacteroidota bacterium]